MKPIILGSLLAALFLAATGVQAGAARPAPASSLLFVGDSITRHAPAPELGWDGDWGMAAGRPEADYVHRLAAKFSAQNPDAPRVAVHAVGGGTLAGKLADAARLAAMARDADLIVVQLGENDHDLSDAGFRDPYEKLLGLLRAANSSARILCTGVWAPPAGDTAKDAVIRSLCARHGALFADLAAANRDPLNRAHATGRWTHVGVNWHPSDAGMAAYADAIWTALSENKIPAPAPILSPAAPVPSAARTLFRASFLENNASALAQWHPDIGVITETSEGTALELRSSDVRDAVMVRHPLDAEALRGRTIQISARIRAADLTPPAQPWDGVKVRLDIEDAEGKHDYPQASLEPGRELPWQTVSFTRRIPANTINLSLDLGLERVSGVLWVQEINVSLLP